MISISKKNEEKIKKIEIKNINKKKRFIPNSDNEEVKKIKKKTIGIKNKCFLTKKYGSKLYFWATDGVAAKDIKPPTIIRKKRNIKTDTNKIIFR